MFKLSLISASVVLGASLLGGCNESSAPAPTATAKNPAPVAAVVEESEIEVRAEALTLFSAEWTLPAGLPSPIGVKPFIQLIEIQSDIPNQIRLAGFGGCNRFFGSAIHKDQTLAFSDISFTEKDCQNAQMVEQEETLLKNLNNATAYSISGRELTLLDKDKKALQAFTAK